MAAYPKQELLQKLWLLLAAHRKHQLLLRKLCLMPWLCRVEEALPPEGVPED